jgi:hypothetical protein
MRNGGESATPASIMKVQGPEEALGILCPVAIQVGGGSHRTSVAQMWRGCLIGCPARGVLGRNM